VTPLLSLPSEVRVTVGGLSPAAPLAAPVAWVDLLEPAELPGDPPVPPAPIDPCETAVGACVGDEPATGLGDGKDFADGSGVVPDAAGAVAGQPAAGAGTML
jgi:hypothetical protein